MIAYTHILALLGVPIWAWMLSLVVAGLIIWFVISRQRNLQQDPTLHANAAADPRTRGTADAFAATNVAMYGGVENGNMDTPVPAAALGSGSQAVHQEREPKNDEARSDEPRPDRA